MREGKPGINGILAVAGQRHTAAQMGVDLLAHIAGGLGEHFQVITGVNTHLLAHIYEVFGGDIALGARGEGAATHGRQGGIKVGDAFFQGYKGIGNAHTVGIVQVSTDVICADQADHVAEDFPGVGGGGDTGSIGQAKVLHTDAVGLFHDPIQALQRDLITEGRTEHARQSQLDANIAGLLGSQLLELSHALLNGTAGIAEVVLLAGADHEGQHMGAGRDGVIGAALIKGQGAEGAAFSAA